MASQKEVTIKCGACKVPVEGPAHAKDEDRFACPRCGRSDTLKNILAEVEKSAADQLAGHVDDMFRNAFRGSKHLKVTSSPIPKKARRFIVEMKF